MTDRPTEPRLRVLLVDDDEEEYLLTLDLLSHRLPLPDGMKQARFQLDWVDNAAAGLRAIQSCSHDAYLIDYMIGPHDGLALIRRALAVGCTAPLILMTGQGDYRVDLEAMRTGATDYLSKHEVTAPLLERTIRYAVERKRTEQALRRAQDELEIRVQERTVELASANQRLAQAYEGLEQTNAQLALANRELHEEIAERKRVEAALTAERQRLFNLLDELPAFVFLEAPDHSVRFGNYQFQQQFGDSQAGKRCYQMIHHRETPCENCPTVQIFQTQSPSIWEMAAPSGESFQVYGYPFTDIDGSQLVMELGIDITQRKQAERRLAESYREVLSLSQAEHDQRLFAEGLTQASTILNASLDLDEVLDQLLEQIHGVIPCQASILALIDGGTTQVVRHRGLDHRLRPFQAQQTEFDANRLVERYQSILESIQTRWRTGPEFATLTEQLPGLEWVHSYAAAPLIVTGEVSGFLIVLSDESNNLGQQTALRLQAFASQAGIAVHNARLYQELEAALSQEQAIRAQLIKAEKFGAIGRMVGSVAHELNNPLQTIKNCLFLVKQDRDANPGLQEYLEIAASETQRLSNLVTQLREVYRPRSRMPLQILDLGQVLKEVQVLLESAVQYHNVTWELITGDLPCQIHASADQIKQVFINIATNAIDAMQPEGGTLSIRLSQSPAQQQAHVVIQDTGPGVPPDIISQLFEPFFTTKASGLGLGLAISHEIVEQMGGRMEVESLPGQGATFHVWLPQANNTG